MTAAVSVLRSKADILTRDIRVLQRDIVLLRAQVRKGNVKSKSSLERPISLNPAKEDLAFGEGELREYADTISAAFTRALVTSEPNDRVLTYSSPRVEIVFQGTALAVPIDQNTLFSYLISQASHFWRLPIYQIQVTDQTGVIYTDTLNVFKTLLPWGDAMPARWKPQVQLFVQDSWDNASSSHDKHPILLEDSHLNDQTVYTTHADGPLEDRKTLAGTQKMRRIKWSIVSKSVGALLLFILVFWSIAYERQFIWSGSVVHGLNHFFTGSQTPFEHFTLQNEGSFLYIPSNSRMRQELVKFAEISLVVGEFIYNVPMPLYELRQQRADSHLCTHDDLGDYVCSGSDLTDKALGSYPGGKHRDQDATSFVRLETTLASLDGYLVDMDSYDYASSIKLLNRLFVENWLDGGTRTVFVTVNFFNPHLKLAAAYLMFFEVRDNEFYRPGLRVFIASTDMDSWQNLAFQISQAFLILMLLALETYILFSPIQAARFFEFRHVPAKQTHSFEEILLLLATHSKRSFFRRLRRPTFQESWRLVTLLLLLALLIAKRLIYNSILDDLAEETEYSLLIASLQSMNVAYDIQVLGGLLLAIIIYNKTRIWFPRLSFFTGMLSTVRLTQAFSEILFFLGAASLLLFGMVLFLYFLLGPFASMLSRIDLAFVTMCSLFLGSWNINLEFYTFLGFWSFLPMLVLFMLVRYFLLLLQVCNIAYQVSIATQKKRQTKRMKKLKKPQVVP